MGSERPGAGAGPTDGPVGAGRALACRNRRHQPGPRRGQQPAVARRVARRLPCGRRGLQQRAARYARAVDEAPGRRPYASRAGEKLAGALDALVLDPSGWRCLDIGASTGGFTDVLLRRGATHVTAVDVGRGLLESTLAADPRVTLLEGMNARHLAPSDVAPPYDLAVLDVSFISLELIVPRVLPLVPAGKVLALVKPQFELDRADVAPGAGVVRDPVLRARAVRRVIRVLVSAGWGIEGIVESSLAGPRGNREVFVLAASGEGWSAEQIEQRILAEVHRGEG
ncbi:MAG: TlyA family RNA methyltransferase [Acidobacteria bacterium]|nr:TlyA family RNA methyltransferase [Acidobacteriota bacterium]